jgi:hypothetical protein
LCAFALRKGAEAKAGHRDNPLHHGGIALLKPLIRRRTENLRDVLEWFSNEEKKNRDPGLMDFDLSDVDLNNIGER